MTEQKAEKPKRELPLSRQLVNKQTEDVYASALAWVTATLFLWILT